MTKKSLLANQILGDLGQLSIEGQEKEIEMLMEKMTTLREIINEEEKIRSDWEERLSDDDFFGRVSPIK